jgi:AhpD family alkylhydroperoxidase
MRLPPLPEEKWDDQVRAALIGMLPRDRQNAKNAGHALGTLLNHPDLAKAFLAFNIHLLFRSTLSPRLRELAILRVAALRDCDYEWAHHVLLAAREGLSEPEIEAAGRGEADDDLDAAVLRAVTEMESSFRMSDGTWDALRAHLSERQVMDLIFTVGAYGLLSTAFNTFGTEPEHER